MKRRGIRKEWRKTRGMKKNGEEQACGRCYVPLSWP